MTEWNLGPGWREVTYTEWRSADVPDYEDQAFLRIGKHERYWVREKPVPPLPTEPYTVIRVTWGSKAAGTLVLDDDGTWRSLFGGEYSDADMAEITGFEVLSEPRAVTAKAVLDRIASEPWAREVDLSTWRREFGVES